LKQQKTKKLSLEEIQTIIFQMEDKGKYEVTIPCSLSKLKSVLLTTKQQTFLPKIAPIRINV